MSIQPTLLIVPGWHNSGPSHWQSLWADHIPDTVRVQQTDWDRPSKLAWVNTLAQAVLQQPSPVVVAAHSLGCIALSQHRGGQQQRPLLLGAHGGSLCASLGQRNDAIAKRRAYQRRFGLEGMALGFGAVADFDGHASALGDATSHFGMWTRILI